MPRVSKPSEIVSCAECGASFETKRSGRFCCLDHKTAFANRSLKRGARLVPYVLAWHATRHAEPGSEEAEVCRFARSELTTMARIFLEDDAKEGRPSVAGYVKSAMNSGTLYIDRKRPDERR